MDVINNMTALSPPASLKKTQAFLGLVEFRRMHVPGSSQFVSLYIEQLKRGTISSRALSNNNL